jgi:hypothetical protein
MSAPSRKTSRPWEPQRSRQEAQSPNATLSAGARGCFGLETVPTLAGSRFSTP